MAIIDEIKSMKKEGKSDQEIISFLKSGGVSQQEIVDSLTQLKIKEAVNEESEDIKENKYDIMERDVKKEEMDDNNSRFEGMEPSILNQEPEQKTEEYVPQAGEYANNPQYEQQYDSGQYQQYQPSGISADTITEISEQVLAEKISPLKNQIEKVIDMRNVFESKIEYIDERIKRIEKIIDRLQLSVLQKVGDYITNVEDIKKEVQETQKSFKSIMDSHKTLHQNKK